MYWVEGGGEVRSVTLTINPTAFRCTWTSTPLTIILQRTIARWPALVRSAARSTGWRSSSTSIFAWSIAIPRHSLTWNAKIVIRCSGSGKHSRIIHLPTWSLAAAWSVSCVTNSLRVWQACQATSWNITPTVVRIVQSRLRPSLLSNNIWQLMALSVKIVVKFLLQKNGWNSTCKII